jgi:glycosyltransferase involved in cell wall biosynthesis
VTKSFPAECVTEATVRRGRVVVVAPTPPPYGGMALQAKLLERQLRGDEQNVTVLPSNLPFPAGMTFLENVRGVRPFLRSVFFSAALWQKAMHADVIHVFAASWLYFFLVVAPAVLIATARGKRIVLNYRGGEAAVFFRWFGWAAKPFFRLASVVTTPSEFLARVIGGRFRVPVTIVPNVVETSKFRHRARTRVRPTMVVARHLEKSYDVESVLQAFAAVQQRHAEASLRIAGSGSEEPRLRELVSRWKLRNVEFLGQVAHERLPDVYDDCDILLNASLIDNFPGALIEASAAGLVVVSTSAPGIAYMYENKKTAMLAKPGDWKGLADAVETVLADPTLARELTANAAALARSCDWRNVRRLLYESYGFVSGH